MALATNETVEFKPIRPFGMDRITRYTTRQTFKFIKISKTRNGQDNTTRQTFKIFKNSQDPTRQHDNTTQQ